MTSEEIKTEADDLRRRRVTTPLIRSMSWYRDLPEWLRIEVEELLGICVGSGLAWKFLAMELNELSEPWRRSTGTSSIRRATIRAKSNGRIFEDLK